MAFGITDVKENVLQQMKIDHRHMQKRILLMKFSIQHVLTVNLLMMNGNLHLLKSNQQVKNDIQHVKNGDQHVQK